jgi:hypothetical protein
VVTDRQVVHPQPDRLNRNTIRPEQLERLTVVTTCDDPSHPRKVDKPAAELIARRGVLEIARRQCPPPSSRRLPPPDILLADDDTAHAVMVRLTHHR